MVHEACGHGFEADFIEKGLSVYAGRIGQKVASELVTVFDDGTLPQKRGTNRIDDEGTPVSKVVLIEKGVLRGYLHSLRTARKMDMRPTGNGRRESYRHLPIPRMRNTCIAPGETPPEKIVASVKEGIFVADIGGGEVDIVTGNFVFHCSEAYRIRNGGIGEALREVLGLRRQGRVPGSRRGRGSRRATLRPGARRLLFHGRTVRPRDRLRHRACEIDRGGRGLRSGEPAARRSGTAAPGYAPVR